MGHRLLFSCAFLACLAPAAALATPTHEAVRLVGTHYQWSGRTPETGFDCSGLVAHVFEQAWAMELPHNAHAQSKLGKRVRLRDLQPGDLVFYNTRNRGAGHASGSRASALPTGVRASMAHGAWSATNDSYSH